jgi:ceramide glucosyltransferase
VRDRLLAILALLSLALTFWRWAVSGNFPLHARGAIPEALPGLALLKPLRGCNAETKRCLRSWFAQKYPGPVQILFGVADASDPVCGIVKELLAEFPGVDARLIVCAEKMGANGKVSSLRQLEPHIRQPLIMISDADVEVPDDFAAGVAPMLAASGAGLVNCFYRLANPATAAMRWEAVAINADFWSSVLQARSLGPVKFALGAVISLPAAMLQKIGGFAPLADYLADDYQIGQNVAQAGGRIDFASAVVDCREAPAGWAAIWSHQLRWARTIRVCQPLPYFLSVLGNATLWPLLWLIFGNRAGASPFFLVALFFRIITAANQQKRLTQSTLRLAWLWMPPVKDMLDFFIWAAAFWGNHVQWQNQRYRVLPGGKLLLLQ